MTHSTIGDLYREIRRSPFPLPANLALRSARARLRMLERIEALGIVWDPDLSGLAASWKENGFVIRVSLRIDEHGWDAHGDELGRFTSTWEPGAIRHWHGDRHSHTWFVPADPEHGKALYDRARKYGDFWWHVGLVVDAERHGIRLAQTSLWGLESDMDEEEFLALSLELADEVLDEAAKSIELLCDRNCA